MRRAGSRIWFDVTELMSWHGPVTGLQRVNLSYVQRAVETESAIGLISYDDASGVFSELPAGLFRAHFSTPGSRATPPPRLRFRAALIRTGKKVFPARLYSAFSAVYLGMSNLALRARRFLSKTVQDPRPAPFGDGDQYVLLGNIWGRTGLLEGIERLPADHRPKVIIMICDIIPIVRPDFFEPAFARRFAAGVRRVLQTADRLLTISRYSREDLSRQLEREGLCRPIMVCRLGDDPGEEGSEVSPPAELDGVRFVLSVGTIEIRKNHRVLLEAWARLRPEGVQLVLVGRRGWLVDELVRDLDAGAFGEGVVWMEEVPDSQLRWLYENCLFTVYPSLYEGWGLPVAESVFRGKFCLSSRASSMPEIAGNLLDYFDPNDISDCETQLRLLLQEPKHLLERERRLRESYNGVTWRQATDELLKALREDHS